MSKSHELSDTPLLSRLRSAVDDLDPAERRVADQILADPGAVGGWGIADVARAAGTSTTTVVRLCQRLGATGYRQARLEMAVEAERGLATDDGKRAPQQPAPSVPTLDTHGLISAVTASHLSAINDTAAHVDPETLTRAAMLCAQAERLVVFGVGTSRLVAEDFVRKLRRIDSNARCPTERHDCLTEIALLSHDDVVLVISHTGGTSEVLDALRAATAKRCTTIGVLGTSGSPADVRVDIALYATAPETVFRSGAMASRIAQLTMIDYLFVAIGQYSHRRSMHALEATFEAVQADEMSADVTNVEEA